MSQTVVKQSKQKHPGLLSNSIFALFKMALLSLLSWLVLMIYFIGECFIKNPDNVLAHAENIVIINTYIIENSSSILAKWLIRGFYECNEKFIYIFNQFNSFRLSILQTAGHLLLLTTEIDLSRLFIFLITLPLFALIVLVFATDGLVKRDIRKFQGARESTFTFHRIKQLTSLCFFLPFFIYMAMPISITPIFTLSIQILLVGICVWLSTTYFKKYV